MGLDEIIFLVTESPEGGYAARALGESIFTEADNLDQLRDHIRDAIRCHFDEGKAPGIARLHFVREDVLVV
jgi:hypothetical protein